MSDRPLPPVVPDPLVLARINDRFDRLRQRDELVRQRCDQFDRLLAPHLQRTAARDDQQQRATG